MRLVRKDGKKLWAVDPQTGEEFLLKGRALKHWVDLEYMRRDLEDYTNRIVLAQDKLISEEAERLRG